MIVVENEGEAASAVLHPAVDIVKKHYFRLRRGKNKLERLFPETLAYTTGCSTWTGSRRARKYYNRLKRVACMTS